MENRFRRAPAFPLASWLRDFVRPRYLSLGISVFLAMYVGMRFVLVVFNAADLAERWSFELTPLATLNLPDVQLALLCGVATTANAFLHYSVERKHRLGAMGLTASMVVGLLLALKDAPADLDAVNLGRLAVLMILLASVPLDHLDILRSEAERELESLIEADLGILRETTADRVRPTEDQVATALRELEALVSDLPEEIPAPEFPAMEAEPAAPGTVDDEYFQELLTSVLEELEEEAARPLPPPPPPPEFDQLVEEPPVIEPLESLLGRASARRSLLRRLRPSPEALLEDAHRLVEAGRLEKALRRLDRLADLDPRYPGLWTLAAEAYEALGEPRIAEECRRRERPEWQLGRTDAR